MTATAAYDITANVATPFETAGLQLFIDDKPITESITGLKTDEERFDVYKEMELGSVELEKGTHVLKLLITGTYLNIDWLKFTDPNNPSAIVSNTRFVPQANSIYNVFSVTGKHMGRIQAKENVTEALQNAGYARGTYIVRSINHSQTLQVQVK